MKRTNILKENKWRIIAIIFICLFSLAFVTCGFLFAQTTYPARIATKIGVCGGGYKPSEREAYLIKAWNESLEDFNADVVFLGNSITAGGDWTERFQDLSVCNLGVPGDSVEQILYRVDMAIGLQPKKIFILAGVNNISRGRYKETIKEKYSLILQRLCEIDCEVYVQSIFPVRNPSDVDNKRIEVANEIIKELANEYGCVFIDTYNVFVNEDKEMREELTKDGIHLNEDGYAVWIEQIEDYVRD